MTDQFPPPPQQPMPPQGGQPYYGQPMMPPKKSNLARNIIIGVILFFVLMCGGCFAIVGFGANEVAKEADKSLKSSDASSSNDKPDDKKAGATKSEGKSEESKEQPKTDAIGTEGNPAPRGKAVENKSAKYQIDKVEIRDSLGEFADAPGGKYVLVTLTIQNVKDKTIQVSSGDFTLQVGGNEIDASDNAFMLDNAFSYDDLSPGLKRTGVVVFDVAPKDAGKGVLKAQAMLSMDEAIYLKLAK